MVTQESKVPTPTQSEVLSNRRSYIQCPAYAPKLIVLVPSDDAARVLDQHLSRFPTHLNVTHSNSAANFRDYLEMGYEKVGVDQFNPQ